MSHKKIVIEILNQKFKDLIEDFSTPQFIFSVQNLIYEKMGDELSYEDTKVMVNELITPLLMQFGMWSIENK